MSSRALIPSSMDLGAGGYCGVCRTNSANPACTSGAVVAEREHGCGTQAPISGSFTVWISMGQMAAFWLRSPTLAIGQRYRTHSYRLDVRLLHILGLGLAEETAKLPSIRPIQSSDSVSLNLAPPVNGNLGDTTGISLGQMLPREAIHSDGDCC